MRFNHTKSAIHSPGHSHSLFTSARDSEAAHWTLVLHIPVNLFTKCQYKTNAGSSLTMPRVRCKQLSEARLDARTYTFAHPIWRTTNAARKHGAISPIVPVFCRYYLCDAIMLTKPSMVRSWTTGITPLEVAIVVVNFAWDARMNTVNLCWMRERIKQDARTSLLMRERTYIVRGTPTNMD